MKQFEVWRKLDIWNATFNFQFFHLWLWVTMILDCPRQLPVYCTMVNRHPWQVSFLVLKTCIPEIEFEWSEKKHEENMKKCRDNMNKFLSPGVPQTPDATQNLGDQDTWCPSDFYCLLSWFLGLSWILMKILNLMIMFLYNRSSVS